MKGRHISALATALVVAGVAAGPALAQKSKDTIRFALTESLKALSTYWYPHREGSFMYNAVYETLIVYDERTKKYVPRLAESWKQVDPTTVEFVVRDDIKFHNGHKFDADDVVYVINWLTGPQGKQLYAPRSYSWIKGVEKVGPRTVRIFAKAPSPAVLLRLAKSVVMLDSELHSSLEHKELYGREGVGTGVYKVVEMTDAGSVTFVRNDDYAKGDHRPVARVKNLQGVFMPDSQTQIAGLMTNSIEVMRDPSADDMKGLLANPNLRATGRDSISMTYVQFDALNRSGVGVLKDPRVRRAMVMAVDREALKPFVPGGQFSKIIDSMCFRAMIGCDFDVVPPAKYDPEGAKKLLAEAGYPNGFKIVITSLNVTQRIAIAVAGFWEKIGINAEVQNLTSAAMRKRRNDGGLQVLINERPYESFPDGSYVLNRFFTGPRRTYVDDPVLNKLDKEGLKTFDVEKRERIYKQAMDRVNTQAYVLPLASLPHVFVHNKNVTFHPNELSTYETTMADFGWK